MRAMYLMGLQLSLLKYTRTAYTTNLIPACIVCCMLEFNHSGSRELILLYVQASCSNVLWFSS